MGGMRGVRKDGVAHVCARRVLRDQRAMHWQEASRGRGSSSTSPDLRLGCDPLWTLPVGVAGLGRGEEAGTRRGGCRAWSGRVAASLAALLHSSISHLLQHPDQVLEAEFSSPLAPLGFFAALCCASACFPSRAAALLLTLSVQALELPDAGLPCSCLSQAKPSCCCSDLEPPSLELPQQHTSIHPILFEALYVMGQQLRGCRDPFLEALSTF